MRKLLFILMILIACQSCLVSSKQRAEQFDKEKWLVSTDYRYEISKSNIFPDLKGKSKKQVIKLLGKPNEQEDNVFTYCLELSSPKIYDEKLQKVICNCKGSFFTVDFKIDERWRTTFFWK